MTNINSKKVKKFSRSARCSLLRTEGFSYSFDVLLLTIVKFSMFGHQNPVSGSGTGVGSALTKMLVQIQIRIEINAYPKHSFQHIFGLIERWKIKCFDLGFVLPGLSSEPNVLFSSLIRILCEQI